MIRVRTPNSLRRLVQLAAEHWADAGRASQKRAELDAQMAPLIEQLAALQAERAKWNDENNESQALAYDYAGMVRQACEDNGWALPEGMPALPSIEEPPGPKSIEAAARAAATSTQPAPVARYASPTQSDGEIVCTNCPDSVHREGDMWVHDSTMHPQCDPPEDEITRPDDARIVPPAGVSGEQQGVDHG